MVSSRVRDSRWTNASVHAAVIATGAAVALAEVGRRARHVAPYRPVLERVDIRVPTGTETPPRLRIGFIADTHLGSVIRAADIDRALALLLAAGPDLLLFGGDYVSESPRHAPLYIERIAGEPSKISGRILAPALGVNSNDQIFIEISVLRLDSQRCKRPVYDIITRSVLNCRGPDDILKRVRPRKDV